MSFGGPGLSSSDSLSGSLLSRSRFCCSPQISLERDSASLSTAGSARPSADSAIRVGFLDLSGAYHRQSGSQLSPAYLPKGKPRPRDGQRLTQRHTALGASQRSPGLEGWGFAFCGKMLSLASQKRLTESPEDRGRPGGNSMPACGGCSVP